MIKTQGFLHLTISVTDLDRATAFYQNVLGCKLFQTRIWRIALMKKTNL